MIVTFLPELTPCNIVYMQPYDVSDNVAHFFRVRYGGINVCQKLLLSIRQLHISQLCATRPVRLGKIRVLHRGVYYSRTRL